MTGTKLPPARAHGTLEEMAFLNRLGTFSEHPTLSRRQYLETYKLSAEKRVNWGKIDKAKVLAHADELLIAL